MLLERITAEDYPQWLELWQGYLEFYETNLDEEVTKSTFQRIIQDEIHGVLAKDQQGKALGLVHFLEHQSSWSTAKVCYLEDLYVSPASRGQGIGEALIDYVVTYAKEHRLSKVYWLTKESNTTARKLYDRLSSQTGFIHYEITELF